MTSATSRTVTPRLHTTSSRRHDDDDVGGLGLTNIPGAQFTNIVVKTCRKICHKIIITHHLRCHKTILRHVVNEFTEFIFNDRNFFHEGVLLSW